VELAAAEAAEEDPMFAPDRVRRDAGRLFAGVEAAWDARDRRRLAELVAPDLLREWERRLDDFERRGWHNRVSLLDAPAIEYVGISRRGKDHGDRVTVRIEARLRDFVEDRHGSRIKHSGRVGEVVRMREFWTLRRGGASGWLLESVEQGAEGAHALEDEVVATPWSDEQALRDEALIEQAMADALPAEVKPAEVADLQFKGGARAAALDLSLADGRFAPDVLEVAARRVVAAWAEAVDGDDRGLRAIAERGAVDQLLYPGDAHRRTRLVVRGPRVKRISIDDLDAAADPPTMTIEVEIEGRRYLEDRDTAAVLAGSRSRAITFTERWKLALGGDETQPWRITAPGPRAAPCG
jgi:predicted lipid-binding transport protein (Tim44 family)